MTLIQIVDDDTDVAKTIEINLTQIALTRIGFAKLKIRISNSDTDFS